MPYGPNPANYLVGGARFYVKPAGTTSYLDLGNVVDPTFSSNVQTLEHFTSRSGINRKDRREVTQIEYMWNFTLDEINEENLNLFFLGGGTTAMTAQSAGTAFADSVTTVLGRTVRLAKRKITPGTFTMATSGVEGTDYVVDYEIGAITALTATAVGAKVPTYDHGAISVTTAKKFFPGKSGGLQNLDGALGIIVDSDGTIKEWDCAKATIQPNGDLSIVNQSNWSTMPFTLSVLDSGSATSPFGTFSMY